MAFQTNTFQNSAFQILAGRSPQKYKEEEDKQIILNLKRWDEEETEILLEYKRREELDEQIRLIARDQKEQDEIMEMLAALLLADEY